ncbi:hypothetical protein [Nonomuraea sediminis]|uniref:hypothetical protein n=1 Tax=Nonomuraea sediminis TaxID=2835864 RepID=UPI001BDD2473|nr:hypothetical protein [Nonomuraea sediminis]
MVPDQSDASGSGRPVLNYELATLLSEAGFSREALARQVALQARQEYGLRLAYDYRSVGRWLRGSVPEPPIPEVIAQVLTRAVGRMVTVNELGFQRGGQVTPGVEFPQTPDQVVESVTELWRVSNERPNAFGQASFHPVQALETTVDWRFGRPGTPSSRTGSRQVVAADVERVRSTHIEFKNLDHTHGGGFALGWLVRYLREDVALLLRGRYGHAVGRDLFQSAAVLTNLVGWMAYDYGRHALAQHHFTHAAALAQQAGDPLYGAAVIGNLATQALYLGHHRTALRLSLAARDGAGRWAPQGLLARLAGTELRALALLNDRSEFAKTRRLADRAMERRNEAEEPDWMGTFTPAHFAGSTIHALRDLGRAKEARDLLDDALDLPARHSRARSLHQVLAASVLACCGELDGACELARPALAAARAIKSTRLAERLNEFARQVEGDADSELVSAFLTEVNDI